MASANTKLMRSSGGARLARDRRHLSGLVEAALRIQELGQTYGNRGEERLVADALAAPRRPAGGAPRGRRVARVMLDPCPVQRTPAALTVIPADR